MGPRTLTTTGLRRRVMAGEFFTILFLKKLQTNKTIFSLKYREGEGWMTVATGGGGPKMAG